MAHLFCCGAESGLDTGDDYSTVTGNPGFSPANARVVNGVGGSNCYSFTTNNNTNYREWVWPFGVESLTMLELAIKRTGDSDQLTVEFLLGAVVTTTLLFQGGGTTGLNIPTSVTVYRGEASAGDVKGSGQLGFVDGEYGVVHFRMRNAFGGYFQVYKEGNTTTPVFEYAGEFRGPGNEIPDRFRIYGSGPYYVDDIVFFDTGGAPNDAMNGCTIVDALPTSTIANAWDSGDHTDVNTYTDDSNFISQNDGSPQNSDIEFGFTSPATGVLAGVMMMSRIGSTSPTTNPDRFSTRATLGPTETSPRQDPTAFVWYSDFIEDMPNAAGVKITAADIATIQWRWRARN